ncbi:ACP S-malonyltransferase [Vulgatibacter sp.]|uniref:ACP S-malonyltransferase n=1 Tax=Vulgatibacter sp. TaxID=1971226 RepID=UPI003569FAB5
MAAKVAFVFPGQGSQSVGMGKALAESFAEAREIFDRADAALGEKLSTMCFEGPDEALKLTANTQPSILTVSVAAHAVFARAFGKAPAFVAGHSLGEWSALAAMGSMSIEDAVRAVRQRGLFMQEAVPAGQGAMAAVLGLDPALVRQACEESAQGEIVAPANYNSPEQTVIAGGAAAVERASARCKELGARRALPLPVSAPFHCAMMAPVQPRLLAVLDAMEILAPSAPVVTNVEAKPNADAGRIRELLVQQVVAPVRWIECVEAMAAEGVTHMVELGPGKVLAGLVKRIDKSIEVVNVEDPASLDKAVAALA